MSSKRLGILIIHGMGDPRPDFASEQIATIRSRLGNAAGAVAFEACHWSPIVQQSQDRTWERMLTSRMDAKRIRRWVVSSMGDPVCYLSGFFRAGRPVYAQIHECVRDRLAALAAQMSEPDTTPLLVLAHSLGSVIMSNYLWDENNGHGVGRTAFERGDTLTKLITYGSNLPLFLPPTPATCIKFPSPRAPDLLRDLARWTNVYDPDDVLGYPLRDVWDDTQGTAIHDVVINVGAWPVSETPFAHTAYVTDPGFLTLVTEQIHDLLFRQDLLDGIRGASPITA